MVTDQQEFASPIVRVGSVSFLNARPLIWGLEQTAGVQLMLDAPARLLQGMYDAPFDVALLPVIDYQRMQDLRIIPSGAIGCDGPTLTVRVFSRTPAEKMQVLSCDPESHTSVALARIVLAEKFRVRPVFVPLSKEDRDIQAMLLIGDKVVCQQPQGYAYQMDLGEQWKQMTGLPFVFAVWMARAGTELGDLPARLAKAKRDGLRHVEEIVQQYALPLGWPVHTARRYLTEYLRYDVGARQIEAMAKFFELAAKHGAIEGPVRQIELWPEGGKNRG
jgi:chorismate dehydratase